MSDMIDWNYFIFKTINLVVVYQICVDGRHILKQWLLKRSLTSSRASATPPNLPPFAISAPGGLMKVELMPNEPIDGSGSNHDEKETKSNTTTGDDGDDSELTDDESQPLSERAKANALKRGSGKASKSTRKGKRARKGKNDETTTSAAAAAMDDGNSGADKQWKRIYRQVIEIPMPPSLIATTSSCSISMELADIKSADFAIAIRLGRLREWRLSVDTDGIVSGRPLESRVKVWLTDQHNNMIPLQQYIHLLTMLEPFKFFVLPRDSFVKVSDWRDVRVTEWMKDAATSEERKQLAAKLTQSDEQKLTFPMAIIKGPSNQAARLVVRGPHIGVDITTNNHVLITNDDNTTSSDSQHGSSGSSQIAKIKHKMATSEEFTLEAGQVDHLTITAIVANDTPKLLGYDEAAAAEANDTKSETKAAIPNGDSKTNGGDDDDDTDSDDDSDEKRASSEGSSGVRVKTEPRPSTTTAVVDHEEGVVLSSQPLLEGEPNDAKKKRKRGEGSSEGKVAKKRNRVDLTVSSAAPPPTATLASSKPKPMIIGSRTRFASIEVTCYDSSDNKVPYQRGMVELYTETPGLSIHTKDEKDRKQIIANHGVARWTDVHLVYDTPFGLASGTPAPHMGMLKARLVPAPSKRSIVVAPQHNHGELLLSIYPLENRVAALRAAIHPPPTSSTVVVGTPYPNIAVIFELDHGGGTRTFADLSEADRNTIVKGLQVVCSHEKKVINHIYPASPEWDTTLQRYTYHPIHEGAGARLRSVGTYSWRCVWNETRHPYLNAMIRSQCTLIASEMTLMATPGALFALKILQANPLHWSATNIKDPKRPNSKYGDTQYSF
jgi:hypothetical protein